jgi:hypothetical protein
LLPISVESCGSTLPTLITSFCPPIPPVVKLAESWGGSAVLVVVVGPVSVFELPELSGGLKNVTV